jgi:hypothetical protein
MEKHGAMIKLSKNQPLGGLYKSVGTVGPEDPSPGLVSTH